MQNAKSKMQNVKGKFIKLTLNPEHSVTTKFAALLPFQA